MADIGAGIQAGGENAERPVSAAAGAAGGGIMDQFPAAAQYTVFHAEDLTLLWQDTAGTVQVTADTDPVAQIDTDPASYNADQADGATTNWKYGDGANANAIGGKPVFYFVGTEGIGGTLATDKNFSTYVTAATAFTMMVVLKPIGTPADNKMVFGLNGNQLTSRYRTSGSGSYDDYGFVTAFITDNIIVGDTDPRLIVINFDGSNAKHNINGGTDETIGAITGAAADAVLQLFGASNHAIACIAISRIEDTDRATTAANLVSYYGIS